MPYTENDPKLPDRIKRLPADTRRRWVSTWNNVFSRCQREGGEDCEGQAFRVANGLIAKVDNMITADGLSITLDDLISALKRPEGGQRRILQQAQQKRAEQFGIGVQAKAPLTIPANLVRMGAKVADFADSVNFRIPVWLSVSDREALSPAQLRQVQNATTRFNKIKDSYDEVSRVAVERRIEEAHRKFNVGRFAEMEKAWDCEVVKVEKKKQVALSVALKASSEENGMRPDSQGDVLSVAEVEQAAYGFMLNSQTMDLHHQETLSKSRVSVVESYLAPVEFAMGGAEVKRGDWIVGVRFFDDELWQKVESGEIKAFSIKGTGIRRPLS